MNLSGDFIGRVVYDPNVNEDVTHTGRCKIRVFGLFDELKDEELPWFAPANLHVFSDNGAGNLDVPKNGAIVRVRFPNGDLLSGEYTSVQVVDPALVKEIEDDYKDAHVLLFDGEEDLTIIYQKMTGLKLFHKGASIIMDPNGNIQLKHQNNSNVIELNQNNITITSANGGAGGSNASGTIEISSGNTINITGNSAVNVLSDNIKLGTTGGRHVAVAEEVINSFRAMLTLVAKKFPMGTDMLTGESFSNITSNNITCD